MQTLAKLPLMVGVLVVTALAPLAAAAPGDGPATRLVVAFHHVPDGVAPHGRYLGAEVLSVDAALGFAVVSTPDSASFRAQARQHDDVRAVDDDPLLALAAFSPNDPEFADGQYGPQMIGAPAAWNTSIGAGAPPICFVDTGIRATHVEFGGRVAGGIDLVNNDADATDDNGHGTHVAGIAAAGIDNGLGIAGIAQAPILAAKVLDASGNGYMSTVASGIRWCADNGARIISMSVGSTAPATAVADAVDYAWAKGAILVAAAGNGYCSGCVQYPAAYTNVIAVGCVDPSAAVCGFESQGPEIDLAAPGSAIESTWFTSDTAMMHAAGTSMSAPHVAGAAALVWAAHPAYTNAQVRQALESSAQDVGAAGKDVATGYGIVRADLAMASNVSAAPPPPPPVSHGVVISPASQAKMVAAKATTSYVFTIQNTGSAQDTIQLSRSMSRTGWSTSLSAQSLLLQPGASAQVTLTVTAPQKSPAMTVTLTANAGGVLASATAQTTIGK